MVVFKPCDGAMAREVFEARGIPYEAEPCFAYTTQLGGDEYCCLCSVTGTSVQVLDLDFGAGPVIAEGLLRAALNFAAGRSAYTANCHRAELFDFLLGMGFRREGASVCGEIPDLLTGACHGCSGK